MNRFDWIKVTKYHFIVIFPLTINHSPFKNAISGCPNLNFLTQSKIDELYFCFFSYLKMIPFCAKVRSSYSELRLKCTFFSNGPNKSAGHNIFHPISYFMYKFLNTAIFCVFLNEFMIARVTGTPDVA